MARKNRKRNRNRKSKETRTTTKNESLDTPAPVAVIQDTAGEEKAAEEFAALETATQDAANQEAVLAADDSAFNQLTSAVESQIEAVIQAVDEIQAVDDALTSEQSAEQQVLEQQPESCPSTEPTFQLPIVADEVPCDVSLEEGSLADALLSELIEHEATEDDTTACDAIEDVTADYLGDDSVVENVDPNTDESVHENAYAYPAETSPMADAPSLSADDRWSQQVSEIIATNTAVLQQVVQQMANLPSSNEAGFSDNQSAVQGDPDLLAEVQRLADQVEFLQGQLDESNQVNVDLQQQLDDVWGKHDQLSRQLDSAKSARQEAPNESSSGGEAMTWEQRKELMLRQMEDDSFDAESFVQDMQSDSSNYAVADPSELDPSEYVGQLNEELQRLQDELRTRDEKVDELQMSLEEAKASRPTSDSDGSASIEELVDVDALIRDERERLQQQQKEWEDRFRETEISASLERAKLSRERRELARQNAELEEHLVHVRRETEADQKSGVKGSRRWLAKLGLADD